MSNNIEDIQDNVDKLVLKVFEAVIAHKSLTINNPNNELIEFHSNNIINRAKQSEKEA